MKPLRFTCLLFCVSILAFLASCGGGGDKTTSTDTTATTDTSSMQTAPVNTIVTTPQNMMVVTHKVADFTKWKTSYEAHDSFRLANGIHSYVIGRALKDSNMILVAVKVDDMAKAKAYAKRRSNRQAFD